MQIEKTRINGERLLTELMPPVRTSEDHDMLCIEREESKRRESVKEHMLHHEDSLVLGGVCHTNLS